MKKIIVFGALTAIFLLAVSVYAHGENEENGDGWHGMMGSYGGLHEEVDKILDTGSFEQLEEIREESGMPILYWVNDSEDFKLAKDVHEKVKQSPKKIFGGCHDR